MATVLGWFYSDVTIITFSFWLLVVISAGEGLRVETSCLFHVLCYVRALVNEFVLLSHLLFRPQELAAKDEKWFCNYWKTLSPYHCCLHMWLYYDVTCRCCVLYVRRNYIYSLCIFFNKTAMYNILKLTHWARDLASFLVALCIPMHNNISLLHVCLHVCVAYQPMVMCTDNRRHWVSATCLDPLLQLINYS